MNKREHKTRLEIGCPHCGGAVGQESGFYACLNKKCGWHNTGANTVGHSLMRRGYYDPDAVVSRSIIDEFSGQYSRSPKGEWQKVIGVKDDKDLDF